MALQNHPLREHHDFSQHFSTHSPIQLPADMCSVLVLNRMWRHGIHSVLEIYDIDCHSPIALQNCVLHEHHKFFPAYQHKSTSPASSRYVLSSRSPVKRGALELHHSLSFIRCRKPESNGTPKPFAPQN